MRKKVFIGVLVSFFIFAIIIPLVINVLFKYDFGIEFLRAEWSAGDMLVYCGTIISIFFAVGGVWLSIKENNSLNRENIRISTLPFMMLKIVDPTTENSSLKNEKVIKLHNGHFDRDDLTEYDIDILKAKYLAEYKGVAYEGKCDRAIGWISLRNTGRGTALLPSVAIIKDGEVDDGGMRWEVCDELPPNEVADVLFYTDEIKEEDDANCNDYSVILEYYDIWGNKYRLTNGLSIVKENSKLSTMWGIDWQPELVENINELRRNMLGK